MSDKSFGDCPSKNIVKNPLLSTAVTGLSIEDLTHNAVLVPVAATQGLITRSDHQIASTIRPLGYPEHETTNFPSGDSNTNVFSPLTTLSAHPQPLDQPQPPEQETKPDIPTSTVSKASLKSDDDFDVNEYFARLHGTRYVSAPINSNPDQNANLAAAEESLEEINLNDEKSMEVQQSLTADIAQNFSQLPTVLPHVASAVFSSFSNMLNYKSREQTPDERTAGCQNQEVQFQSPGPVSGFIGQNLEMATPTMAEDVVKEVAPPPKELPNSGLSNFRITTKKKYAQIPGLSSGTNFETSQKIELNPLTKNVKNYFVPSNEDNIYIEQISTPAQETNNTAEQTRQNIQETYNIFSTIGDSDSKASDFEPSVFSITKEMGPKPFEERLPPPPSTFDLYGSNAPGNAIPPPPMFSTQRSGPSQTGKSVLPPSVARRIGSNHPVIKQQTMQSINTENIFVPTFDPISYPTGAPAQSIGSSFSDLHSQSAFGTQTLVTEQPTAQSQYMQTENMPSIPPPAEFTQPLPLGFTAPSMGQPTGVIAPPSKAQTRLPPQNISSPRTNMMSTNNIAAPPMFALTLASNTPSMFVPPTAQVDGKTNSGAESSVPPSSNVFSPTSQVAAQSIAPPGTIQPPPIGSFPNSGPISFFTPPPLTDAPSFYNPAVQEQPKPQAFSSEPPKPLIEPPKATGAINYRMNKKRPQYYSGPIEGVGSISNSIKPVIPSIDSGTFQGALFTPEQPQTDQNVTSSIPFDLSKQAETVPLIPQYDTANPPLNVQPPAAFDISQPAPGYPHFDITHRIQDTEQQYNTAFDLSRATTDNYEQREEPKESKGFGIIGSLKSKLSSIDINKIQHSVTTFFDPAYKDTTSEETAASIAQQNAPYSNVPYEAYSTQTNLEIFVPNVQQNTQPYNYDFQQHQNAIYLNNEYYKYPNFQNQGQPSAGHCSNSHHYPSHSPHPKPYNNNVQQGCTEQNTDLTIFQPTQEDTNEDTTRDDTKSYKDHQELNTERNMDDNVARADSEVTRLVQSRTLIEERFAHFDLDNLSEQKPKVSAADVKVTHHAVASQGTQDRTFINESFEQIQHDVQESNPNSVAMFDPNTVNLFAKMTIDSKGADNKTTSNHHAVASQVTQDRTFINESFEQIQHDVQESNPNPVAMFDPNTVNLFAKMTIDSKGADNKTTSNTFASKDFENTENKNISIYGAHGNSFANIKPDIETIEDVSDYKKETQEVNEEFKTHNLLASTTFDNKKNTIPKDNLLGSLTKEDVPILGVSSVPLFGLSAIANERAADMASLSDRNSSISFFDHANKLQDYGAKNGDALNRNSTFSFFESVNTSTQQEDDYDNNKNINMLSGKSNATFFENVDASSQETKDYIPQSQDKDQNKNNTEDISTEVQGYTENDSELSICETCREVNKPDEKEDDQDVTNQLIENITSRIQLSNPVETTLTEPAVPVPTSSEQMKYDAGQYDEISHITEETIETIQVQSATELLEDVDEMKTMNYGWTESVIKEDYNFTVDPNSLGFYGSNSLFFNKIPTSTDDIKHHEDLLARQMSMPSAPPAEEVEEEDSKSDEAGTLDVNSIEQDANKDFPLFEEFVIEPSDKDDDDKDRAESDLDSFTNRIEKYKKMDPTEGVDHQSLFYDVAPQPISMVSYFDTGNYAVEAHYRNTNTRPAPSIPPGFEEEFKRRVALAKQREEKIRNEMVTVPDCSTQTRTTSVATYCSSRIAPSYSKIQPIIPVGFNIEANITSLVDEQSEPLPELSTPPATILGKAFDKKLADEKEKAHDVPKESNVKPEEKQMKLPPIPNVFDPKPTEKKESKLTEFSFTGFKPDEETPLPELLTAFSSKADEKPETILPPYTAFTNLMQEDNPETILPPFAAFASSKPDKIPESMPPPFAAFSTANSDDNPGMIAPPFGLFATSNQEDKAETILPPIGAFTTKNLEEKPETIMPPFELFTTPNLKENPETIAPPFGLFSTTIPEAKSGTIAPLFTPFVTSKPDEKPETIAPPFGLFTTTNQKEKAEITLPSFTATNAETKAVTIVPPFELFTAPNQEEKSGTILPPFGAFSTPLPEKAEPKLPDPLNFFSDAATNNPPESFSRLASYFSSPPKTEQAKSFFELSQSQNHYRHASSAEKAKIIDVIKDLTSVQNIPVPKDQTIKHVNYFTVEYDTVLPEFNNLPSKDKFELADDFEGIDLDNLYTNCRHCAKIFDNNFRVRKAVNDNPESGSVNTPKMEPHKEAGRNSVTVDFGEKSIQEDYNEGVSGMTENRSATEYSPVKHHWFYRVDVEDNKSIWRGFSVMDSRALETAYLNPDLNEQTVVATDGGRYDVNVVGRLRIPVYWSDKPSNVRRCSWFYKGTTDARYVPYTEAVAEKLEEEYRHGMTTSEWHRRLVLPNGEVVVMHGPSVMVHFLHSDAFSSPPLFSFGKRVYRNPPKIRVSRDQPLKIDHLILLVHGAGEFKCQKDKNQSCSRPRVVRRGHDESEIEDTEPSSIDHLLLLCHGVGSACDMRFRSVEEVVEDFRSTSLQLVQSHYRNSYDQGIVSRVEVLPISWHATLHSGETGVDCRLAQITLDSIPRLRNFTNETVLDVLFYTSPVFCQTILNTVCKELNRIYKLFQERNPSFNGGVSLGGHSLGSVILYDLLCHQTDVETETTQAEKSYVQGPAGTGQPYVRYPRLAFAPDAMYALGSPIAIFECIRGVESLGANFSLPTCKNFFNIFHPYDPIAYRIEPLINPELRALKPQLIPHHKGRKRMHLELKDTMARVGADLKQKLVESLKSTWNKWKSQPTSDGQLEQVVEEEMEKEQLTDECKEELAREIELSNPQMLGRLNSGRRVDYVLQEAPLELINEYLFAMSSHVGYWESEDTMLLMLREIYSALGVQPDSTVPQQNMTVQRTRTPKQDETIVINAECPSTSRGSV